MSDESELAKRIRQTYLQAAKEVQQKLKAFKEAHEKRAQEMLKKVADGKITEKQYKDWLQGQVFIGKRWEEKLKDITQVYVDADKKAKELVGGTTKNVFVKFANSTAKELHRGTHGAVSFDLYDRKTVERLLKKDPQMLPEWKINEKKDYTWNYKRVKNAVAQGIIQGESVGKIGTRLAAELSASNANKMNMFARTAITGAENAGRIDRLHEAQEMGISVKKKWLSAHDARVRDAHAELDGVEQDVDKPFRLQDGREIDYPGDPTADPDLVYNCRCTLVYVYKLEESVKEQAQATEEDVQTEERRAVAQELQDVTVKKSTSIESLRDVAESSRDAVDFWMNLDEEQQQVLMASGIRYDDAYNSLGGGTKQLEWKPANPGSYKDFAIKYDYSEKNVDFIEVKPPNEGWMAEASRGELIQIRKGGLGNDWREIMTHEMGHQLSTLCPELAQTILNNPDDVLGRYNLRLMAFDGLAYNPEESFADCVKEYVLHPNHLKKLYPKAYDALDAFFTESPSALDFIKRGVSEYEKRFRK